MIIPDAIRNKFQHVGLTDFLTKSVWLFSSVGIRAIGQLALNKIVAVTAGPAGVAFLAQFINILTILVGFSTDGVNRGLLALWPGSSKESRESLFRQAFRWNFFLLTTEGLVIFIFYYFGEALIPPSLFSIHAPVLVGVTAGHFCLQFWLNYLVLHQRFSHQAFWILASQLTGIILAMVGLVGHFSFQFIVYGFFTGQVIPVLFIYLTKFLNELRFSIGLRKKEDTNNFKKIGTYVGLALFGLGAGKLTDQLAMSLCEYRFGPYQLGLWQALVRISDLLLIPFTVLVNSLIFPWFSRHIHNPGKLRNRLRIFLMVLILGAIPGFFCYRLLLPFLLRVINSNAFLPAIDFSTFQILGDLIKLPAYVLGFLLLSQQRTTTFLILEILSAVAYILLLYLSELNTGLGWFTQAHCFRYLFYFCILVFISRRQIF